MEPEAIQTAPAVAPAEASAGSTEPSGEQTPKMIPFPADKLRALNLEVSQLRKEAASKNFTNPSTEGLEPSAKQALTMIKDEVRSGIVPELDSIRTDLEEAKFERSIEDLRRDPTASRYATSIVAEMESIARSNPSLSRSEMLERAKKEAIYKAVMDGSYQSAATETAAEEILGDRSRFANTPQRGATQTGRGRETVPLEELSAADLAADPEKFAALFEQSMGRKPRR